MAIPHFFDSDECDLLYHYTSPSGALGILDSAAIWLSDFAKMNDTTEYQYARERYIHHYQARDIWIAETPRFLTTFALIALEEHTKMLIGCLTQQGNNDAHWKEYAHDGAGCAFGLSAKYLQDEAGVNIRRVVYEDQKLRDFIGAGLRMLQEEHETEESTNDSLSELAGYFVSDLYAFKHPSFAHEQEVRISRMVVTDNAEASGYADPGGQTADNRKIAALPVKLRNGERGQTAYIELPMLNSSVCAIMSITCGRNASGTLLNEIKSHSLVKAFSIDVQQISQEF